MADNMTPEQRRMTMSRIRGRDTKVELAVRKELHRRGYRFRVNTAWLAGKPDGKRSLEYVLAQRLIV